MYGFIYKITNKINRKIYVGQTVQAINKRWAAHCSLFSGSRSAVKNAIKKYGKENFEVIQIDTANSKEELDKKELFWIFFFNSLAPSGYNLKVGGSRGRLLQKQIDIMKKQRNTPEYKAYASAMAKQRWAKKTEEKKNLEKKRLREIRALGATNLSLSNKKMWSDPDYRKKMSIKSKKMWLSESYRRSKQGKNHHASRKVICVEAQICFYSILDAAKWVDEKNFLNKSKNINACCKHRPSKKTAYGYSWKYAEEIL